MEVVGELQAPPATAIYLDPNKLADPAVIQRTTWRLERDSGGIAQVLVPGGGVRTTQAR